LTKSALNAPQDDAAGDAPRLSTPLSPRSLPRSIALAVVLFLLFASFAGLSAWQIGRRAWKLDLIDRVEQRVHAPAAAAPASSAWPRISAASDEYRHVSVTGRFLHEREIVVRASTELGAGFWVLAPLQLHDGTIVLVNRGFVPPELKVRSTRAAGEPHGDVTIAGLLRMTEPRGALLRRNDPAADRWYSRDIAAMASAHGLTDVAPYFIDADASSDPALSAPGTSTQPIGGLTVIAFANNHLVYAITWFALALMVVMGAALLFRSERSAPFDE
jgi:surfeit locus 1 family protein